MSLGHIIAGEVVKALAVLALVFLSFAHQPVELQYPGGDSPYLTAIDLSFCGDDSGEGGSPHSPCHACRVNVGDLPASPCIAEPAYAAFGVFDSEFADDVVIGQTNFSNKTPRAPPALA